MHLLVLEDRLRVWQNQEFFGKIAVEVFSKFNLRLCVHFLLADIDLFFIFDLINLLGSTEFSWWHFEKFV